jgi:hypothetical protein
MDATRNPDRDALVEADDALWRFVLFFSWLFSSPGRKEYSVTTHSSGPAARQSGNAMSRGTHVGVGVSEQTSWASILELLRLLGDQ